MNTVVGGIISTCILTLVFIYAGIKFNHLINRENPNINKIDIEDYYSVEEVLNLTEIGFRVAWSVEGNLDKQNKIDSKYVKWLSRISGKKDGEWYQKIMPIHKCNEDDFT